MSLEVAGYYSINFSKDSVYWKMEKRCINYYYQFKPYGIKNLFIEWTLTHTLDKSTIATR